jgi:hypothetical protein
MTVMQNRPASGTIRRLTAAKIAGRRASAIHDRAAEKARERLPLFAQFPPSALFMAFDRAVSRRTGTALVASGTTIAFGRRGRARGASALVLT